MQDSSKVIYICSIVLMSTPTLTLNVPSKQYKYIIGSTIWKVACFVGTLVALDHAAPLYTALGDAVMKVVEFAPESITVKSGEKH